MSDGLALIIGSGLSCSEGLPSMYALGERLNRDVPARLNEADATYWETVYPVIESSNLELALLRHAPPANVELVIGDVVAKYMVDEEAKVIADVFTNGRVLPLSRLFKNLMKPEGGIPVITTNYDRLIEVAAEEAGLGVDDMFVGRFSGQLNDHESRMSFCRSYTKRGKSFGLVYRPHIKIFKPHGSLSWYLRDGQPVSYEGNIDQRRLIITPGTNKFLYGYDTPFDKHRERANGAIDKASKLLIIGYGFNDAHLETHLLKKIESGTPTLILTMALSAKAQSIAASNANVIALESFKAEDGIGTTATINCETGIFPDQSLWNLDCFLKEVLRQ